MSEQPVVAVTGAEYAVPWPMGPIPGTSMLTFWGTGYQTTEAFVLPGDASMRIVVEKGPLVLRVLHPDGTDATKFASIPNAGMALGAIPQGGTYTLEVRTAGQWGVTIVFAT